MISVISLSLLSMIYPSWLYSACWIAITWWSAQINCTDAFQSWLFDVCCQCATFSVICSHSQYSWLGVADWNFSYIHAWLSKKIELQLFRTIVTMVEWLWLNLNWYFHFCSQCYWFHYLNLPKNENGLPRWFFSLTPFFKIFSQKFPNKTNALASLIYSFLISETNPLLWIKCLT